MIRAENISKNYAEKKILEAIDIELPKEKLIAFIGPNGAGKSTFLSLIPLVMEYTERHSPNTISEVIPFSFSFSLKIGVPVNPINKAFVNVFFICLCISPN